MIFITQYSMDKKVLAKRVQGMSIDEAAQYLMNNYPVTQISEALADLLLTDFQPIKPVIITEEEFNAHFRIRGTTTDNQVERRGRPAGSKNKPKKEEGPILPI